MSPKCSLAESFTIIVTKPVFINQLFGSIYPSMVTYQFQLSQLNLSALLNRCHILKSVARSSRKKCENTDYFILSRVCFHYVQQCFGNSISLNREQACSCHTLQGLSQAMGLSMCLTNSFSCSFSWVLTWNSDSVGIAFIATARIWSFLDYIGVCKGFPASHSGLKETVLLHRLPDKGTPACRSLGFLFDYQVLWVPG